MKLIEYYSDLNKTLAVCGAAFNVRASVFRDWLFHNKMPNRKHMKKIFLWSGGQVQPNDFYPIDDWKKELNDTQTNQLS